MAKSSTKPSGSSAADDVAVVEAAPVALLSFTDFRRRGEIARGCEQAFERYMRRLGDNDAVPSLSLDDWRAAWQTFQKRPIGRR